MEYLHELFSGDDTSELILLDLTAFVIEKIATNRERNKTSSSSVKRQTKSSFLQTSKDVSCMAPLVLGNGVFWTVLQTQGKTWILVEYDPLKWKGKLFLSFTREIWGKGFLTLLSLKRILSLEDFSCSLLGRSSWTTCSRTCPSTNSSPLPWQCCTSTRNWIPALR